LDLTITTKINVVAGDDQQKGMLVQQCQINDISFPRINSPGLAMIPAGSILDRISQNRKRSILDRSRIDP
jgi:hypothetical protein